MAGASNTDRDTSPIPFAYTVQFDDARVAAPLAASSQSHAKQEFHADLWARANNARIQQPVPLQFNEAWLLQQQRQAQIQQQQQQQQLQGYSILPQQYNAATAGQRQFTNEAFSGSSQPSGSVHTLADQHTNTLVQRPTHPTIAVPALEQDTVESVDDVTSLSVATEAPRTAKKYPRKQSQDPIRGPYRARIAHGGTSSTLARAGDAEENERRSSGHDLHAKQRRRTTTAQLEVLEADFLTCPKPDVDARQIIAAKCGMTSRDIQIWFQNRRAKQKKIDAKMADAVSQDAASDMSSYGMSPEMTSPHTFSASPAKSVPSLAPTAVLEMSRYTPAMLDYTRQLTSGTQTPFQSPTSVRLPASPLHAGSHSVEVSIGSGHDARRPSLSPYQATPTTNQSVIGDVYASVPQSTLHAIPYARQPSSHSGHSHQASPASAPVTSVRASPQSENLLFSIPPTLASASRTTSDSSIPGSSDNESTGPITPISPFAYPVPGHSAYEYASMKLDPHFGTANAPTYAQHVVPTDFSQVAPSSLQDQRLISPSQAIPGPSLSLWSNQSFEAGWPNANTEEGNSATSQINPAYTSAYQTVLQPVYTHDALLPTSQIEEAAGYVQGNAHPLQDDLPSAMYRRHSVAVIGDVQPVAPLVPHHRSSSVETVEPARYWQTISHQAPSNGIYWQPQGQHFPRTFPYATQNASSYLAPLSAGRSDMNHRRFSVTALGSIAEQPARV